MFINIYNYYSFILLIFSYIISLSIYIQFIINVFFLFIVLKLLQLVLFTKCRTSRCNCCYEKYNYVLLLLIIFNIYFIIVIYYYFWKLLLFINILQLLLPKTFYNT